jgi:hypothetical protein
MRPSAYSTMTLTKEKADELAKRQIKKPAITLVGMTTPVSFFGSLRADAVADGFLGRFIVHQSDMPRAVHDDKDLMDVPYKIIDWIETLQDRAGYTHGVIDAAAEEPKVNTIPFKPEALLKIREFSQECVDMANDLEKFGLEALPGRAKEMAMRISLIVQMAVNVKSTSIGVEAIDWAIDYMRFSVNQTAGTLKMKMSGSSFEADKKEVLSAIRDAGEMGVTWKDMQKTSPFSKYKKRDLGDIMDSLLAAELVTHKRVNEGKRGRPRSICGDRLK